MLHSITNDSWNFVVSSLRYFTFTKFYQLKKDVKKNLLRLVEHIVALNGHGVDGLIVGLLRQIRIGDHGAVNTSFCKDLLELFVRNITWIHGQLNFIPFIFFPLARLLAEEGIDPTVFQLASELCLDLLKNRHKECVSIGRDFVRVLLPLSRLEGFKSFWSWFTQPIDTSNPLSSPISDILGIPTQKKFLACRLTPLMETELLFIMESVESGAESDIYKEWFIQSHFSKGMHDDRNILIADLIRYIVAVYHPSNAVLASGSVQRWEAITWLYSQVNNESAAFEALFSIYFDWFVFNPLIDSIMNVEPGCLVLTKGINKLPALPVGALSYLAYYKHQFGSHPQTSIMQCIDGAMKVCIEKGVTSSLKQISNSTLIDASIKMLLGVLFPSSITETPIADPRKSRSEPTNSIVASRAPSPLIPTTSPIRHESDNIVVELEREEQDLIFSRVALLLKKLDILLNSNSENEMISILKHQIDHLSLSVQVYREKILALISTSVKLREMFGIETPFIPPKTSNEYSTFKTDLLNSSTVYTFPSTSFLQHVVESRTWSPTEQIWFWKSIVLLVQSLPLEKIEDVPNLVRGALEYVHEDQEILNTGLQDVLTTLNARSKVIPKIFEGLPATGAFKEFIEQAISLRDR